MEDIYNTNLKLTDKQFLFLTEYLSTKYGLRITEEKRVLLECRLKSRMNHLKMKTIEEYITYTFNSDKDNKEYKLFIEQITTHKTFFFRESHQFDFLSAIIKDYIQTLSSHRPLMVWSAGCSTGEEVFTLGMTLQERKSEIPLLDYKIVGTDISVPSLEKAAKGFFLNELETIPEHFKKKYFEPFIYEGKQGLLFTSTEIRNKIHLGVFNLKKSIYNVPYLFDFIFCRNVTIYFDAKTRIEVLEKIISKLKTGGYLFLGHSETALGLSLPLRNIKPTIYQKI